MLTALSAPDQGPGWPGLCGCHVGSLGREVCPARGIGGTLEQEVTRKVQAEAWRGCGCLEPAEGHRTGPCSWPGQRLEALHLREPFIQSTPCGTRLCPCPLRGPGH